MDTYERRFNWDSRMLSDYFQIQMKAKDFQKISFQFNKYVKNANLIEGEGLK